MYYSKVRYLGILLVIIINACNSGPIIRFLEPQPEKKRDLNNIPKSYQGSYISMEDSSILKINSERIIQEWYGCHKISLDEMQEEWDTVYYEDVDIVINKNWNVNISVNNDSATISSSRLDTLFKINDSTKLRNYKGYLFLNYLQSDSSWKVKVAGLRKNCLEIDDLLNASEIDSLKEIIPFEIEIDTTSNTRQKQELKPKKKVVRRILKKKSFAGEFVKQK